MRLYIKNYKLSNILNKIQLLDQYYNNTKNIIEIISEDGIFYVDEKNTYKINIVSDKVIELRSNKLELLLDKSVYNSEISYQLPLDHINNHVTIFYYSLNPKTKIKLVIEGKYNNDKDQINKYYNFSPTDFYFEVPNEKTSFELLNNDDLNVFLSLLN